MSCLLLSFVYIISIVGGEISISARRCIISVYTPMNGYEKLHVPVMK